MSLINCGECEHSISTKTVMCPNCGAVLNTGLRWLLKWTGFIFCCSVMFFGLIIFSVFIALAQK